MSILIFNKLWKLVLISLLQSSKQKQIHLREKTKENTIYLLLQSLPFLVCKNIFLIMHNLLKIILINLDQNKSLLKNHLKKSEIT
jgi:hypothetical protein